METDNKINTISLTPGPTGPTGATGATGPAPDTSTYVLKTTTDNSAVAWSSGLVTDGYHEIFTGSDSL